MPKLTKRVVEATEIRDKDYIIFDNDIPGFGLRVLRSGKRSYMIQYRVGRKTRRMSLGLHGILTPEKARTQAINALAAVKNGEDPAGARDAARNAPTMEDLGRRVILDHATHHCKPRTVVGYRYYLKAYINPCIGKASEGLVDWPLGLLMFPHGNIRRFQKTYTHNLHDPHLQAGHVASCAQTRRGCNQGSDCRGHSGL